jgi:hypothetical protein
VPATCAKSKLAMPQYRRAKIEGSIFFFTVVLAEREANLLVNEIDPSDNATD